MEKLVDKPALAMVVEWCWFQPDFAGVLGHGIYYRQKILNYNWNRIYGQEGMNALSCA
jgi:hypothetical protein